MTAQPTALIADDEPLLRATLTRLLGKAWPELKIVAEARNGREAVEHFESHKPDICFLDVHMPGLTGVDAARAIGRRAHIVFVTAYDDYALQAFERAAIDYVLKPVSDARLGRTVERLKRQLARPRETGDAGLAQLLDQMRALLPGTAPERLTIVRAAVGSVVRMIRVEDILYFQAVDKYVNVVTADGEALIRTSLKDLIVQLDGDVFRQVSRASIVNLRHVASAVRDDAGKTALVLRGCAQRLRVSPLYAHLFRQM